MRLEDVRKKSKDLFKRNNDAFIILKHYFIQEDKSVEDWDIDDFKNSKSYKEYRGHKINDQSFEKILQVARSNQEVFDKILQDERYMILPCFKGFFGFVIFDIYQRNSISYDEDKDKLFDRKRKFIEEGVQIPKGKEPEEIYAPALLKIEKRHFEYNYILFNYYQLKEFAYNFLYQMKSKDVYDFDCQFDEDKYNDIPSSEEEINQMKLPSFVKEQMKTALYQKSQRESDIKMAKNDKKMFDRIFEKDNKDLAAYFLVDKLSKYHHTVYSVYLQEVGDYNDIDNNPLIY